MAWLARLPLARQIQLVFGVFAILIGTATIFGWQVRIQVQAYSTRALAEMEGADSSSVQRDLDRAVVMYRNAIFLVIAAVTIAFMCLFLILRRSVLRPVRDLMGATAEFAGCKDLEKAHAKVKRVSEFSGAELEVRVLATHIESILKTYGLVIAKANAEDEFRAAARLLGHEINNLLVVISARSEMLEDAAKRGELDPARVADSASKIGLAGERIAKISQRLRQFGRGEGSLSDSSNQAA